MKKVFLVLSGLLMAFTGSAQMTKDPTDWKVEVRKGAAGHYTVLYHLALKPGWHIWALKPGGDGLQVSTRFSSNGKTGIKSTGGVQEITRPTTTTMEGVDGKVSYYADKAEFRQDVVGGRGQSVITVVEYQPCNDKMCLPPKKLPLTIILP